MLMYVVLLWLMMMLLLIGMIFFFNQSIWVINLKLIQSMFFMDLELMLNVWSFLFLMMVWMISTSVLFFSCVYMQSYFNHNFLLLYLSFIFSMVWLIVNNNFYWMMLGWDGLGVVSFLLIIFYMNYESINNGLFTIFQNRLGDLFFVFFIVGMLNNSMWCNLDYSWVMIILLLGAMVKSAQFPFNAWLLAAMSAPTPISSLVHSSTLVVAGVYILLQFSYCFNEYLYILKYMSMMTLIISSFGLINESDMKKLIAYSTMSHVGLMMFLYSHQLYKVVYFHLNIHAMFKSFMFMCFGFVMLISFHAQDKRLVSLVNLNPIIKFMYYYSCMCMSGLPFLSAFFSKDFIMEKLMEFSGEMSEIFLLMFFLSLSIYYSFKLVNLTNINYVYCLIENQILGMFGLIFMMIVSISMINLYISLIFSISLEIINFKFMIYLLMLMMLSMALLTNLNFKWQSYDQKKNFKEIWSVDYYKVDQYMYWNMIVLWKIVAKMSNVKLFLLMNWWVMVLVIMIF